LLLSGCSLVAGLGDKQLGDIEERADSGVDAGADVQVEAAAEAGQDSAPDVPTCTTTLHPTTRVQAFLHIIADRSASMYVTPLRWTGQRIAVSEFATQSATGPVELALVFHPHADEATPLAACDDARYRTPSVARALASINGVTIQQTMSSTTQGQASPWEPALRGSVTYTRAVKSGHPSTNVAMIFIADDTPSYGMLTCATDGPSLAALVAPAAAEGIRTYAIGINGDKALLDAIAAAGNTTAARLHPSSPSAGAIRGDLESIRDELACDLNLPDVAVDWTRDSLVVDASRIPKVDTCGTDGFVLKSAKLAHLCPTSCRTLLSNTQAKAQVAICR
jgi:hypothetical protein